ncbi:sce7726 family protein [Leptospira vanthielii]|uniref:Sce7726 family protein n=1 Tax=Leptospira vanthielii TaxID=293085 RepID=A0ABY2NJH0_9LEPT|nr:sce7726 family protein [Leptospira vanthielii]TGM45978.1 hypothetical protein EHQ95_17475 [Leptospira vanthielii]
MIALNDKRIRPKLKKFLITNSKKPIKVVDELHINFGTAIADVVAIDRYMHCFEIKGETDKIQRIETQGKVLDSSFPKVTLVTTENHLVYALKNSPEHWGIIKVSNDKGKIIFRSIRTAKTNPNFNKEIALFSLWKSELLSFSLSNNFEVAERMNKKVISKLISNNLSSKKVIEAIAEIISQRIKS